MRKADDLLQQFLDRIGQSDGAPYVGLFRGWRDIVGHRIADHAEPVDVRGTALIIEADHPGWVQMVMMSRAKILRQLNRRYPELGITGLHIRVSEDRAAAGEQRAAGSRASRPDGQRLSARHDPDAPAPNEPSPAPPSQDDTQALGKIEDDDLRSTLESLRRSLDGESGEDDSSAE